MYHSFHKNIKHHNCFQNQRIRMISEGSCDTEDWSSGCSKIQLCHYRNKWHLTIYSNRKQLYRLFPMYLWNKYVYALKTIIMINFFFTKTLLKTNNHLHTLIKELKLFFYSNVLKLYFKIGFATSQQDKILPVSSTASVMRVNQFRFKYMKIEIN